MSQSSFSYSFIAIFCFSSANNATNLFVHSLDRFVLKECYLHFAGFSNLVPFPFLVYAKKPFKCLQTGQRRELLLFFCKINSFQNQNIYENNFNLIINMNRMFNTNIRIDTYLIKKRQLVVKTSSPIFDFCMQFITLPNDFVHV